jgi:hypothetical protein
VHPVVAARSKIGEGVVEMSMIQLTLGRGADEERGAAKAGNMTVVLGAAEPSGLVVPAGAWCS